MNNYNLFIVFILYILIIILVYDDILKQDDFTYIKQNLIIDKTDIKIKESIKQNIEQLEKEIQNLSIP